VWHRAVNALLIVVCAACTSADGARPNAEPQGPPAVQLDVVDRHAREFTTDLRDRAAGTQGEQAASAYLLGHLQRAGYVVLLDYVPVGDLVRSTNVIARPPSGGDPELVVTVPYDSPSNARTLGLWLELARALRAAVPDHAVEFAALGAEQEDERGSRRLTQELLDEGVDPVVVTFDAGADPMCVEASGALPENIVDALEDAGLGRRGCGRVSTDGVEGVFARAGFDHVVVTGPPEDVGPALLEFLVSTQSSDG
jgi:hypothetical protein